MTHNELMSELMENYTLEGLQQVKYRVEQRIDELEREEREEVERLYEEAEPT